MLIGLGDGGLNRRDIHSGRQLSSTLPSGERDPRFSNSTYYPFCVLSDDCRLLAARHADGRIGLWDVATGRQVRSVGSPDATRAKTPLQQFEAQVFPVGFGTEGRTLVTFGPERTVSTWDTADGRKIASFRVARSLVTKRALSHDGRLLSIPAFSRRDGSEAQGARTVTRYQLHQLVVLLPFARVDNPGLSINLVFKRCRSISTTGSLT